MTSISLFGGVGRRPWAWPVWLFLVVLVFPVPHAIALRNLLLLTGFAALVVGHCRRGNAAWHSPGWQGGWLRAPAVLFGLLTLWLGIQTALVAPQPWSSLDNIRGDWLVPVVWGSIGWAVARGLPVAWSLRAVVLGLLAPILLVLIHQGWGMVWGGGWRAGVMPFAERDFFSLINGLLAAVLIGDRLVVVLGGSSPLRVPPSLGWALLAVAVVADPLIRTRNGTIVLLALLAAALFALLQLGLLRRLRYRLAVAGALAVVVALAAASLRHDDRWRGLTESLAVGIQSSSLYWLNPNAERPTTATGGPLEESAYMRAAWARQAVEAIADHPLGLGFGRDAFGRAIEHRYGHKGMVSSHSGWLDFTLATGIPGIALLLAAATTLIACAWRRFRREGDDAAVLVAFAVSAYLLRCLLDGHLSGWYLSLFGFLLGVLIAATGRESACA